MKKIEKLTSFGMMILVYLLASQKIDANSINGNMVNQNTLRENENYIERLKEINNEKQEAFEINKPIFKENINKNISSKNIEKIDESKYYMGNSDDVIFAFETNGNKSFWKKDDLGYPSVSGFQLNLTPGYSYDDFVKYLERNAKKYYDLFESLGGTKSARNNNPQYIKTFQNLCEKDEEFFTHLRTYANKYLYGRNLEKAKREYKLDISFRHPVVQGIVKTFIGNRNNNLFTVIERMYEKIASKYYECEEREVKNYMKQNMMKKEALNELNDIEFAKLFEECIYEVLPKVLPTAPNAVKMITNNFKRTFANMVYPNINKMPITKEGLKIIERKNYEIFINEILNGLNLPKKYSKYIEEICNTSMSEVEEIMKTEGKNKEEEIKTILIKKYIIA